MRLRSLLVVALSVLIVLTSAGLPTQSVTARSVGADSAFVEVPIRPATQSQLRVRLARHRHGRLRYLGLGMDL